MSSIIVRDLSVAHSLDRRALASVRGGAGTGQSALGGIGPSLAVGAISPKIDININQNITPTQITSINVLNNSIVGPYALNGGLNLAVNPSLWAANYTAV